MDTSLMTKEQKQVVAHVSIDLNVSAQKIAEILGVSRATIYRYAEKPTPEDLRQFETEIRILLFVKQQQVLAELLKNIQDMASQCPEIKDLAFAYGVIFKAKADIEEAEARQVKSIPILGGVQTH